MPYRRYGTVRYGTVRYSITLGGICTVTSTSAEASVAYAAPGDFAGEINIFICHENNIFCLSQSYGACGGGEG